MISGSIPAMPVPEPQIHTDADHQTGFTVQALGVNSDAPELIELKCNSAVGPRFAIISRRDVFQGSRRALMYIA